MTSECQGHNAVVGRSRTVIYCATGIGCNQVTNPVTNPVTQPVTNQVSNQVRNPAPHHTTPHHTTKNTSSLSAAQTRGRADETTLTARINGIDWLDALTAVTVALRPDWSPAAVRRALERDDRPRTVIAAAVLRAREVDVNHPNGLRYIGADHAATPIPPTLTEYRATPRCHHGAESGRCPLCRRHIPAEETP